MNDTIEVKESFSNIITPPDFINSNDHTVLLIDPEWHEIETLALFLNTAKEAFTIYTYREEMNDQVWLDRALQKSSAVIVNTINNNISTLKDRLVCNKEFTVYFYGDKNFLMNNKKINSPIEYFVRYTTP